MYDRQVRIHEPLCASLLLLLGVACTDESATPDPPVGGSGGQGGEGGSSSGAGGCQPGQLAVDGLCVDAGLPTDGCPPGHLLDEESVCQPAGVPAALCGEGFETDGDYGCRAILPPAPCESGLMALPGETVCREVAPCANGTWGDIPVESSTQFVDQGYSGGDGDGTQAKPWTTVSEAVAAADPGAIVAIAAGSYVGEVDVADKPVRLWGRCPALVEIVGTGVHVLEISAGADASEIRDLALTGPIGWAAVAVHGSEGVIFDRVWLHDTLGSRGFDITEDVSSGTGTILSRSLVERTRTNAVMVWGATISMSDTVVRDTQASLNSGIARGLDVAVNTTTQTPSTGTVVRSLFARNSDLGVAAFGSELTVDSVLIQDTLPVAGTGELSRGLYVQYAAGMPAVMTARRTVIEGTHGLGVSAIGATLTLEGVVVRDTDEEEATDSYGYGVTLADHSTALTTTSATLRFCLIDHSRYLGLGAFSAEARLEGLRIRDTRPRASDDRRGMGAWSGPGHSNARASLALLGSVIERNHSTGLQATGMDVTIDRSVISGTKPELATGLFGEGMQLWPDPIAGSASLALTGSLVDDNTACGIHLMGTEGIIEQSIIRQTAASAADGRYGDGIVVSSQDGERGKLTLRASLLEAHHRTGVFVHDSEASIESSIIRAIKAMPADGTLGDAVSAMSGTTSAALTVRNSRLEAAARAGISSFGAQVSLQSSMLLCHPIALNGETFHGFTASFEDLGGNQCTCQGSDPTCKVLSSSIAPPTPLTDPETEPPPSDDGV